ncbi:AraC family transcriptional regulator [Brucella cytisi]|uniref:AraC family transcriptional regulator n=1 Tax=Brucella cytisi TaxID=407152 RepID=UPI00313ECFC3
MTSNRDDLVSTTTFIEDYAGTTLLKSSASLGSLNVQLSSYRITPCQLNLARDSHLKVIMIAEGRIHGSFAEGASTKRLNLETSSVCIIPPRAPLNIRIDSIAEVDVICISERTLQSLTNEFSILTNNLFELNNAFSVQDELLFQTFISMKEVRDYQGTFSRIEMEYLSRLLVSRIITRYSKFNHESLLDSGKLSRSILNKVYTYVEDNLHRRITTNSLCDLAGVGPAHFSRLFKKATGLTVHQYVIAKRIERARTLLETTDTPIAEVAHDCGFADQMHLTRVFGASTGTSPASFRRKIRDRQASPRSSRVN